MAEIVVIGSTNTDMVVKTAYLPKPGETLMGGEFFMNPGGKGANQAVAAARLGGKVSFITKIGRDVFGDESLDNFKKVGINTEYVLVDEQTPSGVALINVDEQAENVIVVAPGANAHLSVQDIDRAAEAIKNADIVLLQLEIPLETVEYTCKLAKQLGKKVVLNPAPATRLPDELLEGLFAITPNETETEMLTGIKITDEASTTEAGNALRNKGVQNVIITLGSEGAFYLSLTEKMQVPGYKVKAVDTTAAGDTFNGALAVKLAAGFTIPEAIDFGNKAAALSVTRLGAQASCPSKQEVEENF
jgi:ribokinase